jgi:Type II secretion system (T2SS), protein F
MCATARLDFEVDHLAHHQDSGEHPEPAPHKHDIADIRGEHRQQIGMVSAPMMTKGKEPMMAADDLASWLTARILALSFLRSRNTFDRLLSASERLPPVGPEFLEVVEGQRVGITIDQGIERMYDRMPMSEVNFLGIVMSIQAKTGGNLSEALNNLSKVLRDRKKLKAKIRAVSQEAKSSAAIIGSLPFVIMGALTILNPTYLLPMFTTDIGNVMLVGCGLWMLTGILVMRQMINFEI